MSVETKQLTEELETEELETKNSLDTPSPLNEKEKEAGKKILTLLRENIINKQRRIGTIQWMTGTNGERILPFLRSTDYTLIPTGQLIKKRIAPLGGEQDRGVGIDGVNQRCLSGVAPTNFETAWGYAQYHKKTIDWIGLEEESFSRAKKSLNFWLADFEKVGFLDDQAAERLAHHFLRIRQFNEERYQKEFSEISKKLLSIIKEDKNFFIFKAIELLEDAFSSEIPAETNPEHDLEATNMLSFLGSKRYSTSFLQSWIESALPYTQSENYCMELETLFKKIALSLSDVDSYKQENHYCLLKADYQYSDLLERVILFRALSTIFNSEEGLESVKKRLKGDSAFLVERSNGSREKLISALEQGPCYRYSDQQKKEMQGLGIIPLVFATTKPINKQEGGMNGEILHQGTLKLGEQINFVITNKENQPKLKRYLKENKLEVEACTIEQFQKVGDYGKLKRADLWQYFKNIKDISREANDRIERAKSVLNELIASATKGEAEALAYSLGIQEAIQSAEQILTNISKTEELLDRILYKPFVLSKEHYNLFFKTEEFTWELVSQFYKEIENVENILRSKLGELEEESDKCPSAMDESLQEDGFGVPEESSKTFSEEQELSSMSSLHFSYKPEQAVPKTSEGLTRSKSEPELHKAKAVSKTRRLSLSLQ